VVAAITEQLRSGRHDLLPAVGWPAVPGALAAACRYGRDPSRGDILVSVD
jgi:hypothetical protein